MHGCIVLARVCVDILHIYFNINIYKYAIFTLFTAFDSHLFSALCIRHFLDWNCVFWIVWLLVYWSWYSLLLLLLFRCAVWWESVAFIVVHLIRLKWVTLNNIRSSFHFISKPKSAHNIVYMLIHSLNAALSHTVYIWLKCYHISMDVYSVRCCIRNASDETYLFWEALFALCRSFVSDWCESVCVCVCFPHKLSHTPKNRDKKKQTLFASSHIFAIVCWRLASFVAAVFWTS